jgi:hypothetical protein
METPGQAIRAAAGRAVSGLSTPADGGRAWPAVSPPLPHPAKPCMQIIGESQSIPIAVCGGWRRAGSERTAQRVLVDGAAAAAPPARHGAAHPLRPADAAAGGGTLARRHPRHG